MNHAYKQLRLVLMQNMTQLLWMAVWQKLCQIQERRRESLAGCKNRQHTVHIYRLETELRVKLKAFKSFSDDVGLQIFKQDQLA